MPATPIRFGFAVPIFANPGMAFFRTPCFERLEWAPIARAVREAERLGYDSLFVADHMFLGRDGAMLEGWTTLAALAGLTRRMLLAPIHLCNGFRHPPLVAKMAATLDVISGGRLIFFYDSGWREAEFRAYGFPWDADVNTRLERMTEGLEIILKMLTQERTTHHGKYYHVEDALCAPQPVQQPHPPVWLGEAKDEPMLAAVARHAQCWNSMPASLPALGTKLEAVRRACAQHGRDYTTLEKSLETQVLIAESDEKIERILARIRRLKKKIDVGSDQDILQFLRATNPHLDDYSTRDKLSEEFVIGTPQEVRRRFQAYLELGFTHFMLWFMDFPSRAGLRLFAREVMPALRAS